MLETVKKKKRGLIQELTVRHNKPASFPEQINSLKLKSKGEFQKFKE